MTIQYELGSRARIARCDVQGCKQFLMVPDVGDMAVREALYHLQWQVVDDYDNPEAATFCPVHKKAKTVTLDGERRGTWFTSFSGRKIYPLDPKPEDISMLDVAHHLSNICRYGGASRYFFPVAQHAVNVALCVEMVTGDRELARWGLHHDNCEYALGDMVRPLKSASAMAPYRDIEAQFMMVMCRALKLPVAEPAIVTEIDRRMCVNEAPVLLGEGSKLWDTPVPPISPEEWHPEATLERMLPEVAELRYLKHYVRLEKYAIQTGDFVELPGVLERMQALEDEIKLIAMRILSV